MSPSYLMVWDTRWLLLFKLNTLLPMHDWSLISSSGLPLKVALKTSFKLQESTFKVLEQILQEIIEHLFSGCDRPLRFLKQQLLIKYTTQTCAHRIETRSCSLGTWPCRIIYRCVYPDSMFCLSLLLKTCSNHDLLFQNL